MCGPHGFEPCEASQMPVLPDCPQSSCPQNRNERSLRNMRGKVGSRHSILLGTRGTIVRSDLLATLWLSTQPM
jgi:hypothetical protein